jgi:hypothetical protein
VTIELDAEVCRLLFDHVTSYEQLEALLLLHARPAQWHSATQVAAALHIDAANAAAALMALARQRLLGAEAAGGAGGQRWLYAPADGRLATSVDKLAQAYGRQRLEVVKQMSANAIERVRSSAARTFADAFLLGGNRRKDGDGGDR